MSEPKWLDMQPGNVLRVYTGRVTYGGPDRLDVTLSGARKTPEGFGAPFAPSGPLLGWGRSQLAVAARVGLTNSERGKQIEKITFEIYAMRYVAEMRQVYSQDPAPFKDLLKRQRAVLVCYCTNAARCHRTVLASALTKLGAVYMGDVDDGFSEPHRCELDDNPFPRF